MKITKRHECVAAQLIEGRLTMEEIAESVKVSRRTLYNWLEDEDFTEMYNRKVRELEARSRRRIVSLANKALDRQEQILTKSKNDNAAAAVAADVLDRAGFKPEDNVNVTAAEAVVIVDDIGGSET